MVHIELSVFEVDRRQHTVSDMFAFRVIEHFDVVEDVLSGLLAGFICSTPDAFPFEQVEEALSDRIVMAIPAPAHRVFDIVGPQKRRPVPAGVYLSIKYTERLADAGLEPSVGTVGCSYDNALAETMIGLFKAEVIHRLGPWKSADAVEWETLKWVDWFNNRRLLEPIGYITPTEAEEAFYANMNILDKVA